MVPEVQLRMQDANKHAAKLARIWIVQAHGLRAEIMLLNSSSHIKSFTHSGQHKHMCAFDMKLPVNHTSSHLKHRKYMSSPWARPTCSRKR